MCMHVLPACMFVCPVHTCYPWRPEAGVGVPETAVTNSCESLCGSGKWNLVPWKSGQSVESSLQPRAGRQKIKLTTSAVCTELSWRSETVGSPLPFGPFTERSDDGGGVEVGGLLEPRSSRPVWATRIFCPPNSKQQKQKSKANKNPKTHADIQPDKTEQKTNSMC